jgi:hypothetical protein
LKREPKRRTNSGGDRHNHGSHVTFLDAGPHPRVTTIDLRRAGSVYTVVITQALHVFTALLLQDNSGKPHPQIQKDGSRDLQGLDFQFGTRSHKSTYLALNNLATYDGV